MRATCLLYVFLYFAALAFADNAIVSNADYRRVREYPTAISPKRLLRVSDSVDEERFQVLRGATGVKTVFQKWTSRVTDFWKELKWRVHESKKIKAFNDAQDQGGLLATLENQNTMDHLLLYVFKSPYEQVKLTELFMKHYGDETMLKALLRTKESKRLETKAIGSHLLDLQLNVYLKRGNSIADVLAKLGVYRDSSVVFDSRLTTLEKFMELSNAKTGGHETMLSVLTTALGGEHVLTASLLIAKTNRNQKPYALNLLKQLVDKWIQEDLSPQTLLKRLHVSQDLKSLDDPVLEIIIKYIPRYNKEKDPKDQFSLLAWFTSNSNEAAVAEALALATRRPGNKIAEALQKELLLKWLTDGKSVDEVFEILKLKAEGYKVLASPKRKILERYIKLVNEKNPYKHPQDLLSVLRKNLEDGDVAMTLVTLMKDPSNREFGAYLQGHLEAVFAKWKSQGVDAGALESKILKDVEDQVMVRMVVERYMKY